MKDDLARFLKRQLKYNRSQNFLILVEDNIHSVGSGSETAGMVMAFGAGELKEDFRGKESNLKKANIMCMPMQQTLPEKI